MSDQSSDSSSIISAIVNGGFTLGNTFLSSYLGSKGDKKAQSRSYRYYKRSLKEAPSLQRQGLEDAGYNPLLALSGSSAQSFQGSSTPSFAPVSDFASSARAGAALAKMFKKQDAEIENIEADTKLKEGQLSAVETQRLQTEANTSLLESQAERSDLAYGRDIADTVGSIAGTGAQLYSAKAMADVARQNAVVNARNATVNERRLDTSTSEIRYDKKGKPIGRIQRDTISAGEPTVKHTASPKSKSNVIGFLGGSAKSAGRAAVSLGKVLGPLLAVPLAEELSRDAEDRSRRVQDSVKRDSGYYKRKYWQPNRVLLH